MNEGTMKAVKVSEYDMYSDSNYWMPGCPKCRMPIFGVTEEDIEQEDRCLCCGQKITLPDEPWVHEYIENNTGRREEEDTCMWCGGRETRVLHKVNGKWRVAGGECRDCGVRYIV